jgi:hypothetical protein
MTGLSLDAAFKQAVIDQFFTSSAPLIEAGPDGHTHVTYPQQSPMQKLVSDVIARNGAEVMNKIFERLDVDDLADRLVVKIREMFIAEEERRMKGGFSSWNRYEEPAWLKEVNQIAKQLVAAEIAERTLRTLESAQNVSSDSEREQN